MLAASNQNEESTGHRLMRVDKQKDGPAQVPPSCSAVAILVGEDLTT